MRNTDFERDPRRIARSRRAVEWIVWKMFTQFLTDYQQQRSALHATIYSRIPFQFGLMQLNACTRTSRSFYMLYVDLIILLVIRATGGCLRTHPRDNARAYTWICALRVLGSLDNVKRSRRANQSMTLARSYRPVFCKNCKARTLISIYAVIRRLVSRCDTSAQRSRFN